MVIKLRNMQTEIDLGMTIHKKLKKGKAAAWNISLYNAYSRMNAITIQKDNANNIIDYTNTNKDNWHRAFKTFSFLPIIPSISYTYMF